TAPSGRFIPADAGNGLLAQVLVQVQPVYPRGCGERTLSLAACGLNTGLSPRMRGTVAQHTGVQVTARFIPADAGNGRHQTPAANLETVYPRGCGERYPSIKEIVGPSGLSPRMRGTVVLPLQCQRPQRFIPADAGNGFHHRPP